MTAEIGRSGTAKLILHYKYAEGAETIAGPTSMYAIRCAIARCLPPEWNPRART
jgi:hypothetical protein